MRRLAIAIILGLCLTLLTAPVVSAAGISVVSKTGDGTWVGNNWQVELYPAETKVTTIELYNSSSSSLDVEVSVVPDSLDGGNVVFRVDDSYFTMIGRGYANVTLSAEATGGTAPGTYSAELELKFEVVSSGGGGGGSRGIGALKITDIEVTNITETAADISWKTNRAATTKFTYWASPEVVIRDSDSTKSHIISLTELESCVDYSFEVKCEDRYGLRDIERSNFTTLCIEPTPTPTPTPKPTLEPATPPVEPTTVPPTIPPGEEEYLEVPSITIYAWLALGAVVVVLAGLGTWFWLWKRRKGKR